jgi:hypothetical protein
MDGTLEVYSHAFLTALKPGRLQGKIAPGRADSQLRDFPSIKDSLFR